MLGLGHSEKKEKKGKESKSIPLEEIRRMAGRGMSDKDIIKELKGRGYSYNEIEKAMLGAVKEGVNEEQPAESTIQYEMPATDDFFAQPATQPQTAFEAPPSFDEVPMNEMSSEQTEAIMEDLIEGVIDEKWGKFQDKIIRMEESFDKLRAEMKQWELRQEQQKHNTPIKELEMRVAEVNEQLEDIEARVGGLEKAFKQFLPALTRNIESLSQIIHELKEKQGMVTEEA